MISLSRDIVAIFGKTMSSLTIVLCLFSTVLSLGWTAEPTVDCPVPVSPTNGQIYLQPSGAVVKYACDPGYVMSGYNYASCIAGIWVPEPPTCQLKGENSLPDTEEKLDEEKLTSRPLFQWDDKVKENSTEEEEDIDGQMQGDDALRLVVYPRGRRVTRIQRIRSGSESEEEEKKRKDSRRPIIYVRQPPLTEKIPEEGVQVVSAPESGVQSDQALRYMYYLAHYIDPRNAEALMRSAGYPYGYALSESQIAWINSLHPEVRDKYLKDLYNVRVVDDSGRSLSHLRSYTDPAYYYYNHYYYNHPYYYANQRSASIVESSVAAYDYSCYQTEDNGSVTKIGAPALRNAHIHRYDRRQNPNYPHNNYLSAIYRCNYGYSLLDSRVKELHCSNRRWVGTSPTCVPRI